MSATNRTLDCPSYDHLETKSKTKSPVWAHFGLPADSAGQIINENIAVCRLCLRGVSAKGGSTSNLFGHLKLYHPIHYSDVSSKRNQGPQVPIVNQMNVDDPNSCVMPGSEHTTVAVKGHVNKKQKTMHDFQPLNTNVAKNYTLSVAKFLATTMQPYNLVEHKAFTDMVNLFNPRYKLPSRKYFSKNEIPKLYNDTVEKIKHKLVKINNSNISITTDCWTSTAGAPYIAITCHFIDEEWELKSFCLRCAHFEKDHTSDNIVETLTNLLADWGLNVKEMASCTTDNGSNILKAIRCLNIPHVPCFGHCINIGVNKALMLPQLNKAIARLKTLQRTIAHSWKMKRDLVKAQEFLKMNVVTIPSACDTRWWSTLKLCRRVLDNQLPLCKMLQDYPAKRYLMPEGSEISALEDFVAATELLKEITTTLSGDEYTTASSVLPLYRKIKRTLQLNEQDSDLMRKIKIELLSPLSERYEKEPLLSTLRMSSLCDPRFRLHFTDCAAEIKDMAIQHLSDLFLQFDEPTANQISVPIPTIRKGLSKLLEDEVLDEPAMTPKRRAEIELNNYLTAPKVNLEANPLSWWKSHESTFPALKNLAKKFLGIQGTSVPSERVFSTGGNVITKHRASLLPKNAEMQVFLAQNKNFVV